MNIIYATTSLKEIKRARAEALKEVPGTKAENCKEVIKEVILFVVTMIVGYPCICSVLGIPVFHLFTEMGGNRLYMLLGLLMYIVIDSVICFIGQRIPLRTPCKSINMINQIFYDETAGIEKAIGQLESMREYVGDGDVENNLLDLKDVAGDIIIRNILGLSGYERLALKDGKKWVLGRA